MTYLCFDYFDLNASEGDIDEAILRGYYILHAYAANQWLYHIREAIKDIMDHSAFQTLCQKINMFLMRRTNPYFRRPNAAYKEIPDLKPFKGQPHNI